MVARKEMEELITMIFISDLGLLVVNFKLMVNNILQKNINFVLVAGFLAV